ncbi:hypothetical protein EX30DRAFT_341850, partial [Ascodesmis nigricans]
MQFNFAVILGLALAANLSTTVLGAPAPSRNRVPEGVPTGSGAGLGRNSDDRGTVVSASVSTDPKARNPKDQSTITVTKQVQYETPEALKDGQFFAEPPIAPAAEAQSHNTLGQRAKPKTSFRDLKKAAGNKIQSSRTAMMGKKEDLNANFEFLTGPLALPSASG